MSRVVKVILTWFLVLTLSANPIWACGLRRARRCCRPVVCCVVVNPCEEGAVEARKADKKIVEEEPPQLEEKTIVKEEPKEPVEDPGEKPFEGLVPADPKDPITKEDPKVPVEPKAPIEDPKVPVEPKDPITKEDPKVPVEPKAPFGDPKVPVEPKAPVEPDPFGAKKAAPAEKPKAEPDPFGAKKAAPAEKPKAEPDPFGAKKAAPAEKPKAEPDPFGAKKAAPAKPAAPAVNDPFSMQLFEDPAEQLVVVEPELVNPMTLPGGLNSTELKTWTDNTGSFSVDGRLVNIMDEKVQLIKANGRFTTFPRHRLSAADHQFVQQQARALATAPPTSTVAK